MNDYSEDSLVEQPAVELFSELGWETANCFYEKFGENGTLGRETSSVIVLVPRLRAALVDLNPDLPSEAIELAIEELTRDRSVMSPANANREVYRMLKNGVKVSFRGKENEEIVRNVQVIDWNDPSNNDFFLASQFWITGEMYKRRADLVGFIQQSFHQFKPELFYSCKHCGVNYESPIGRRRRTGTRHCRSHSPK